MTGARRSLVGRADLVHVLAAWQQHAGAPQGRAVLAALIGFAHEARRLSDRTSAVSSPAGDSSSDEVAAAMLSSLPSTQEAPSATLQTDMPFGGGSSHRLVQAAETVEGDAETFDREQERMKGMRPPSTPPLSPYRRLLPLLNRSLTADLTGGELDLTELVHRWSRGEHLEKMPRLRRRGWPPLLLLVDRDFGLVPFWRDQEELLRRLRGLVGASGLVVRFVDQMGPSEGLLDARGTPVSNCEASLVGLPVLALTDLGWYRGPSHQRAWLRLGRRLRQAGERIHALVPVPKARWTQALTSAWSPIPWERPAHQDRVALDPEVRAQRVDRLLGLAAWAHRLEPGLLRSLRLLLPRASADVGTEADAWLHEDMAASFPTATVLRSERAAARRMHAIHPEPELAKVAEVLHSWHGHGGLPPGLWHIEALGIDYAMPGVMDRTQLERAKGFVAGLGGWARALERRGRGAEMRDGLRRWLEYVEPRSPPELWRSDSDVGRGLQTAWWATHENEDDKPPNAVMRANRNVGADYRLSILHISDLHARNADADGQARRDATSRDRILGKAWDENLRELYPNGERPDLVCFTGDIAFSGLDSEYAEATKFIDRLADVLRLTRSQIYVVPGNHDVNRATSYTEWRELRELAWSDTFATSDWLAGGLSPRKVDPSLADVVLRRTASFWRWVEEDLGRPELLPSRNAHGRLGYRHELQLPHLPFVVQVIGLDSAWSAGGDDEYGKLWLTQHQRELLLRDAEGNPLRDGFRLALVHHPITHLADGDIAQRDLEETVHLLLHGHEHNAVSDRRRQFGRTNTPLVLAAGCMYEGIGGGNVTGCNRIDVTLDQSGRPLRAEIQFRTWSERGHWHVENSLARNSQDGRVVWDTSTRGAEPHRCADNLGEFPPTQSAQAQRELSVALNRLGDVEVEIGNLAVARGHFERSLELAEALARADPHSAAARRELSISLNKLGDVEVEVGNLAVASGHFERSLELREVLARADPHSAAAQRELSVALNRLGDVEVQAGNLAVARGHFERSLELAEALARADPHSAAAQRELSVSLNKLGDVEVEIGNLVVARGHFERSLELAEALARADPHSAAAQRGLSLSLDRLGEVGVQAGNLVVARGHFERSLELAEALARADPHSAAAQRELSLSLNRLGEVEVQAGNLVVARGHFERSFELAEALARADPHSAAAQRELSVSLDNLGDVEVAVGNLAVARGHSERSLEVREALAKADPQSARARRDLSLSLNRLGDLEVDAQGGSIANGSVDAHLDIGRYARAETLARQAIAIWERVYQTREHAEVAALLSRLATVLTREGRYVEAATAYEESIAIEERVYQTREHPSVAASLLRVADVLTSQGRYVEAATAYEESIAIQERLYGTREHASVAASLRDLANVLTEQGKYDEAATAYEESIAVAERVNKTREHVMVAASLHGLANVLTREGRYVEAVKAYEESIAIAERVNKTREHVMVAASLHGLANVLIREGRYVEAAKAYEESVVIQERVYQTREHVDVAATLHGLANVLTSQGRYVEAEKAYEESLAIHERVYKTREHASVAASLRGLANVHVAHGHDGDAERCLREVVAIESAVLGSRRTPITIPTLKCLAELLVRMRRPADALEYARDGWEGALENAEPFAAVAVGPIYVAVLAELGRQDEAQVVSGMVLALQHKLAVWP